MDDIRSTICISHAETPISGTTVVHLKYQHNGTRLWQSKQRQLEKISTKTYFSEIEYFDDFLVINMDVAYNTRMHKWSDHVYI